MSDARFTKGKWFACFGSFNVAILNTDGFAEKQITYTGVDDVPCDIEAEANQKLIASAPDLYAEIERDLIEQLKTQELIKGKLVDEQLKSSITRKQNLLAKARGEL